MSELESLLGNNWQQPPPQPDEQLRKAIMDAGLEPPPSIEMDGRIHRFKSARTKPEKSGWYIAYSDGIPAGAFGCWRAGLDASWCANIGRTLTAQEDAIHRARMEEARALRDAEQITRYQIARETVAAIWEGAKTAPADHPYLVHKRIQPHDMRITSDGRLICPLYDATGALSTLQYISVDGSKLYHPGGKAGGMFHILGVMPERGTLYMAEGFATAASICEATGKACVVAYSASNLVPVAASIRAMARLADIVILADNDESGTGKRFAEQACAASGARMVMPPVIGDANDYACAGNDLKALLEPPADSGWLIPANEFCAQPAPIRWIIRGWLQADALVMVHGPSGGGKTFLVLDWMLRIAAGMPDWFEHKVRPGQVVYLAGEGHHGLRGRVAAWRQHHGAGRLDMWLSRDGCDLNTAGGYNRVVDNIRHGGITPVVIVVDTLHRFLAGDENSAQDAKSMLDACSGLMAEFGCAVVLVHHTGVSDEAQHRARGSSAWRGALDIEVSIVPGKGDQPMQIVQRKSKDAELSAPLYAELQQVEISGWLDDDGEPVSSAVLVRADEPVRVKKESDVSKDVKKFISAWRASGGELMGGVPYLTRSALLNYLVEHDGVSEGSAKQYTKPTASGKLIYNLLLAEIISAVENGWAITDSVTQSSAMII